LWIKGPEVEVA